MELIMSIEESIPYLALSLSVLSLIIAFTNYRRKSGISISGYYVLSQNVDSPQRYISVVALQNNKDRAIAIFEINIKIGNNYYLKIEDFQNEPLILKPYETYTKEYGPIESYGTGMQKINIDLILENTKIRKMIVLSTTEGKYKVKKSIKRWHSIIEGLRNYYIQNVYPLRLKEDQTVFGGNIKYSMEIVGNNNEKQIFAIHPEEYRWKRFKNFELTKASLESQEKLQLFMNNLVDKKVIVCRSINIVDLDKVRKEIRVGIIDKEIDAKNANWFTVNILGNVYSEYRRQKLKRINKKLKNKGK